MGITPEEARRLAEQTEYPTAWKWSEGPNPIVGEYVDDAEATTRFGTTKRIKILRDPDGKRWAVWLLGQLDVQWDELETTPKHGDLIAVWVRPGEKVMSGGGNEYRPSRITHTVKEGSPAPSIDAALPGPSHQDVERVDAGEPPYSYGNALFYRDRLEALGSWPPSPAAVTWFNTHDASQAEAALRAREGTPQRAE